MTFNFIKNRTGPRDKKVDEIQIFPGKGSFREEGTYCDGNGLTSSWSTSSTRT